MKLKSVSTTQFAGIRDRRVDFSDGINVICGPNESGKSTLVNLIAKTLFQSARIDGRRDKLFKDLYLPGPRRGGPSGDFADGSVRFETDEGTFTVNKEWGGPGRVTLNAPSGAIRDPEAAAAELRRALGYGEGVFGELLFSSQHNTDQVLKTLLDASEPSSSKTELTDAVTRAFSESDGLTAEAIEKAIAAKIDAIAGKHWDFDRDAPKRKAGERWKIGVGTLLQSCYDLEDARNALQEQDRLEQAVDDASAALRSLSRDADDAAEEYERFSGYFGRLEALSVHRREAERLRRELAQLQDVQIDWPEKASILTRAAALRKEQLGRAACDRYVRAVSLNGTLRDHERDASLPCPTQEEADEARRAEHQLSRLERALVGIDLTAVIDMMNGHEVTVTSVRTGLPVPLTEGRVNITEAVTVTVPGVMEMRLSPADVDVKDAQEQIRRLKTAIAATLEKYGAERADALDARIRSVDFARKNAAVTRERLDALLGRDDFEALRRAVEEAGPDLREAADIDRDISVLCGRRDINSFIASLETELDGYVRAYGSPDELADRILREELALSREQKAVQAVEDIPEALRRVADPAAQLETLKRVRDERAEKRERALEARSRAQTALEAFSDGMNDDLRDRVRRAEQTYEEQLELLHHWLHIGRVFRRRQQAVRDNPMAGLSRRFAENLAALSSGEVVPEFPDEARLQMTIYSDDRQLDYGKLSEGTKDTVFLAFRLAVLDHLFPEGGVIVLDDPFADMDPQRVSRSCALLKEYAARHQIIVLTCRDEYLPLLEGNQVMLTR